MNFPRYTPKDPQYYAFSVAWRPHDPLLDEASRFAAARGVVGVGGLARRFRIGAVRAARLLHELGERRLLLRWERRYRVAVVNPYAWGALFSYGRVSYITNPGESLKGMAARQLKDSSRWVEIRDINAVKYPDMGPHDYYPAGADIWLPGR